MNSSQQSVLYLMLATPFASIAQSISNGNAMARTTNEKAIDEGILIFN